MSDLAGNPEDSFSHDAVHLFSTFDILHILIDCVLHSFVLLGVYFIEIFKFSLFFILCIENYMKIIEFLM